MKKHVTSLVFFLIAVIFIPCTAFAQVTWAHQYGVGAKVVRMTGTGYVVGGTTSSFGAGGNDIWVASLDLYGNILWQKTFGGTGSDNLSMVNPTCDGGFVIAGYTNSFGAGLNDGWILKLDSSGGIEWQKTYGGTNHDYLYWIEQTEDSGYIIAGTSQYKRLALKLDSQGQIEWQTQISDGSASVSYGYCIKQTADGGYVMGTNIYDSNNGPPPFQFHMVIKLDSSGNPQWKQTYSSGIGNCTIYEIIQTADGGYAFAGFNDGEVANPRADMVKLDSSGNLAWGRSFVDSYMGDRMFYGIRETSDGGFVAAGLHYSLSGMPPIPYSREWLVKTSAAGDVLWKKAYSYSENLSTSLDLASDGGFVFGKDVYRTDANGDVAGCSYIENTTDEVFTTGFSSVKYDLFPSATAFSPADTAVVPGSPSASDILFCGTACAPPSAPSITGMADNDPLSQSGITINFSAGAPATRHDLFVDGSLSYSGVTTPASYDPGDLNLHSYMIRAVGGSDACYADSGIHHFSDVNLPEIATGSSPSDAQLWDGSKTTQSWPSYTPSTGYRLYRGTRSQLSSLLTGTPNSCTRYDGTATSVELSLDDPSEVDGRFYWYLVNACDGSVDGSAGQATESQRQVTSVGVCQ